MNHKLLLNIDLSKFRADEEDAYAYVNSILRKTSKQEMISMLDSMSEEELQSIMVPFITEKISEDLGSKEL